MSRLRRVLGRLRRAPRRARRELERIRRRLDEVRHLPDRLRPPEPEPLDPRTQAELDRLASQLFSAMRREDRTWQERAIAAGDPVELLRTIDPDARWLRSVLVDRWPAYPVRVSGTDAWLIPGRAIADGYPLRAVWFPRFAYLRTRDAKERQHVDAVVEELRKRRLPEASGGQLGVLVVGHDNFAHVFLGTWNALWHGRASHGFRGVDALHDQLAASMGSYTEPELFPELARIVKRMPWQARLLRTYPGTLLPIGIGRDTVFNFHLDTELRRAVRAVALRKHRRAAETIGGRLRRAEVVLWISVRAAGPRNALNFREWMRATVEAVAQRQPGVLLVFDGLSVQPGFSRRSVIRGERTDAQVRRERDLVDEIMQGLGMPHVALSGMPLYDAFHLSTFASFFICHAGTLDHKIKWLNPNLPGVVHGNLERHGTYAWDPTADLVRARYLPAAFIQDRKSANPDAAQLRYAQYPYAVEPVEEAAAWVADEMAAALSAVPVRSSP